MKHDLSRRELLAVSACLPAAASGSANTGWKKPVPLGSSGLLVTRLGMGTEEITDAGVLRRAVDLGIGYFNCLTSRGREGHFALVGEALKPVRDRVVLSQGSSAKTGRELRDDLERRLVKTGTDYFDLFYLVAKSNPESITDEMLTALDKARRAGLIRACGVTTHGTSAITPRLLETKTINAVMLSCNFALSDTPWTDVRELRRAGIGIVAMKPLLAGFASVPAERKDLQSNVDKRMLGAALRWVLNNPLIDTAPAGVRSVSMLEENVSAASLPFTAADEQLLGRHTAAVAPYICRMCGRCQGSCSRGLPVADLIRCVHYLDTYRDRIRARWEFQNLPASARERSCEACEVCTVSCPDGVHVREQVTRAQLLLA